MGEETKVMRKTPYKHIVKEHKRRTPTGRLIKVHRYDRGTGKPSPSKLIKDRVRKNARLTENFIKQIHKTRSKNAQIIDNSLHAPLTTDKELWLHQPNQLDISGVDSPGGFHKVKDVDTSKYSNASLSMNQMGGIYRVDVWDKQGNRVNDKYGFETKEEAKLFIDKVKSENIPSGVEATYNIATGWLQIVFDEKPEREVLDKLKSQGFKYRPSRKAWIAKRTSYRENLLKEMAGVVKEVSFEVDYNKRAEKYQYKADKAREGRDDAWERHDKISSVIPFGQPILVGHHSERRHRNDIERMRTLTKKSIELHDEYKRQQELANEALHIAEHGENPKTIHNRIERLEKQLRNLKGYKSEESKLMIPRLEERLRLEREKYVKSGGLPMDTLSLKKGDVIKTRFGTAEVLKVSRKTVRVNYIDENQKGKSFWQNRILDKKDIRGKVK